MTKEIAMQTELPYWMEMGPPPTPITQEVVIDKGQARRRLRVRRWLQRRRLWHLLPAYRWTLFRFKRFV
jgi:hypothetical protein